jgi:hypothetical protein
VYIENKYIRQCSEEVSEVDIRSVFLRQCYNRQSECGLKQCRVIINLILNMDSADSYYICEDLNMWKFELRIRGKHFFLKSHHLHQLPTLHYQITKITVSRLKLYVTSRTYILCNIKDIRPW